MPLHSFSLVFSLKMQVYNPAMHSRPTWRNQVLSVWYLIWWGLGSGGLEARKQSVAGFFSTSILWKDQTRSFQFKSEAAFLLPHSSKNFKILFLLRAFHRPALFLLLCVLATSMTGLLFPGDDQYWPLCNMLNDWKRFIRKNSVQALEKVNAG